MSEFDLYSCLPQNNYKKFGQYNGRNRLCHYICPMGRACKLYRDNLIQTKGIKQSQLMGRC